MTSKDYIELAGIVGQTLAVATRNGGESTRTEIYESLYRPLVKYFNADNPRFDQLRFAAAVGTSELAYLTRN